MCSTHSGQTLASALLAALLMHQPSILSGVVGAWISVVDPELLVRDRGSLACLNPDHKILEREAEIMTRLDLSRAGDLGSVLARESGKHVAETKGKPGTLIEALRR